MKRIFLFFAFFTTLLLVKAQNFNATAFNAGNWKGEVLFAENANGDITYSDIIQLNGDMDQLRTTVKNYLAEQKAKHDLTLDYELDTDKKIIAKITYPINKEYWAVELWGSPIVSGERDASRITFKCTVSFLNNKFKYTLSDFWTDNRRVFGEAKDNGPTNVIYKQRVGSFQKEYNTYAQSHNAERRSVKEELYDLKANIDYEERQYASSYEAVMNFINGLRQVKVFDANGDFEDDTTVDAGNDSIIARDKIDWSLIHGNLLAKGNPVYVSCERLEPCEQAGAFELIKQISVDDFWRLVTNPSQAYFVLTYHMTTEGRDHAWLEISSCDGKTTCAKMPGNSCGTSESLSENKESARTLYLNVIYPMIQKIGKGKTDKVIALFER